MHRSGSPGGLWCALARGTRAFPVHRDAVRAKAGLGCRGGVGTRWWCSKHAIGVALGVRRLGLVAARKVFDEMPARCGLGRCGCVHVQEVVASLGFTMAVRVRVVVLEKGRPWAVSTSVRAGHGHGKAMAWPRRWCSATRTRDGGLLVWNTARRAPAQERGIGDPRGVLKKVHRPPKYPSQ